MFPLARADHVNGMMAKGELPEGAFKSEKQVNVDVTYWCKDVEAEYLPRAG